MDFVLPVGHYLGPVHPAPESPPTHHSVRVGRTPARLADQDQLDVWLLAHGVPSEVGDRPWSRKLLLEAASETGVGDAEAAFTDLMARGLLIEAAADATDALSPVRHHRLLPLLVGLGTGPGEPLDVIGVPGLLIALKAEPRVFELWEWGHRWPDLWSAWQALSLDDNDGLRAVQTLIAHGAAYLDVIS
ncbi:hypothetical protein [Cryptosporangium sp. NPDC051539]|uniref:hypothetical protein n=1 Tax=Cryptosporangium sp. NPDC051539 TaxID=3363962 RepID=UPI0037B19D4E